MKKSLVEKRGDRFYSKTIKIFDNPENISTIGSELAWRILNSISEKPMYPNEIAKKLKVHEQKVYYHINRMRKSGIVEIVSEEEKHGAVCRYFAPSSRAFGVELPGNDSEVKISTETSPAIRDFFIDFLNENTFNGSIVVGSPSEHGPYLTSALDGHYSAQLAMFIGSVTQAGNRTVVKLDTEVKAEHAEKRNMIVIGGPVTNMIANEINERLKVRFKWENNWTLHSSITKNNYTGDTDALIVRIRNPWDKSKVIILASGIKSEGTKTAIIAITQFHEKLLKNFDEKKDFYAVIRGLDKDGDGKVDDIKIMETSN